MPLSGEGRDNKRLSLQMVKQSERPKSPKGYRKQIGKNQNYIETIITRTDTVLNSINFRISPRVQRNITETILKSFLGKQMSFKILQLNFSYCLKATKLHIQIFKTKINM